MVRLQIAKAEDAGRNGASEHIKRVALRLFAERGVDGVTVREIAAAAGQRNHGAVSYYFGSKESLVRAIVMEGAVALDRHRNAELDRLEAQGGPETIRQVVDVLILPVVALDDDYYVPFIVMLGMSHRDLMMDAIDASWNRAYGRCLDHLRRLLPGLSPALQNQRFIFMGAYLGAVLAARQRALADHSRDHPMWGSQESLEHFAQSLVGLLEAPVELSSNALHRAGNEKLEPRGPMG
jgi:AcrR family transcriptional regulator